MIYQILTWNQMAIHSLLLHLVFVGRLIPSFTAAADSVNQSQSIRDGDTIVSSGGSFMLGFFSPGSSTARYVGIWYNNIPIRTVVWVANRDKPINDSSGVLTVNTTGDLILRQNQTLVWSANSTRRAENMILQLLDTGNLVLRDGDSVSSSDDYLWQSFDYPTDTFLPGMKLGKDLRTGHVWSITSWKSPDDPSSGDITWGLENLDLPEIVGRRGSLMYHSTGPWTGQRFSGAPRQTSSNNLFSASMVSNREEVYYTYKVTGGSSLSRVIVNQTTAHWERSTWSEATQSWMAYVNVPKDDCDSYGICGVYGRCQIDAVPYCQCLKRFSPKFPDRWAANDWSHGCVRNKNLSCGTTTSDGFIRFSGLKFPEAANTSVFNSSDLKDCRNRCLSNCSCMAYANLYIGGSGSGSGCIMWFGDLIDIREVDGEQDLYIRVSASEIEKDGFQTWKAVVIVIVVGSAAVVLAVIFYMRRVWANSKVERTEDKVEGPNDDLEFPSFDLATITKATDNFSLTNKLGEGGFGPVYKGILEDGREVAVKRLSSSSTQGANEFKNEVILIANLQHRNLVKLLGSCIQGIERMLVYECMPNRSLDAFIFDQRRSELLDWRKRFHIICGVARGLVYLHQDSRLRIIHRDLKASNVLLDNEMNPKISDFGMARLFGGDETEGSTNRVVGTFGYMAPEYAIDGLFSVKSDVFSFGILVLEIISGRRNRGFYRSEHNLLGHALKLYDEEKSANLIAPSLAGSCSTVEVVRCVHIALLCLQERAEDRPTMASVVVMLGSEGSLPQPKRPRFISDRSQLTDISSSSGDPGTCSNEVSVSLLEAR